MESSSREVNIFISFQQSI